MFFFALSKATIFLTTTQHLFFTFQIALAFLALSLFPRSVTPKSIDGRQKRSENAPNGSTNHELPSECQNNGCIFVERIANPVPDASMPTLLKDDVDHFKPADPKIPVEGTLLPQVYASPVLSTCPNCIAIRTCYQHIPETLFPAPKFECEWTCADEGRICANFGSCTTMKRNIWMFFQKRGGNLYQAVRRSVGVGCFCLPRTTASSSPAPSESATD